MVIAADSAGVADAIAPSPSVASLGGLDGVNLFLAGALSGFGPYVAAYLAEQKWTQQSIGFVLTAGGFAGLLSQLPGGALLDAIRSKRIAVALGAGMVAAGALIIEVWPSFPLVLAALVLQGITGGFLGLAITAISLGLVGNAALAERLGRNQRFASAGGVLATGFMGLHCLFPVVSRDIHRRCRAGASAAPCSQPGPAFRYPFRPRLVHSGSSRTEPAAESPAPKPLEDPRPAHIRRLRVLISDG
jgi:MFS family permease